MNAKPRSYGRTTAALLVSVLSLLPTVPLLAQEPAPQPPQQQIPDSLREVVQEYQDKQQRFQSLQVQALQGSPELQERQIEVRARLEEAVHEEDPQTGANLERLQELESEAMAAQQEQNPSRLQALVQEAQQIQLRIQTAQERAMARPEIQEEIDAFQVEMMEEMTRIDPGAPALEEEIRAIETRLGIG